MRISYPINEKDQIQFEIKETSGYGWRTLNGIRSFHRGIDLAPILGKANLNIPIIAPIDGRLTTAYDYSSKGKDGSYAKCSKVFGVDGKVYFMAHLDRWVLRSGDVKQGDLLGYMGKTGNATGIHLHFGIWNSNTSLASIDPDKQGLKYFIPLPIINTEMITLQKEITIKTLNVDPMNLRKTPEATETFGQIVPGNALFKTIVVASGKEISQNNRTSSLWYQISVDGNLGYVNGCWVDEIQENLSAIKNENEALKQENISLKTKVEVARKAGNDLVNEMNK